LGAPRTSPIAADAEGAFSRIENELPLRWLRRMPLAQPNGLGRTGVRSRHLARGEAALGRTSTIPA